MEDHSTELSLPFVRFAPFFAAGMVGAYFGGVSGAIVFAAAAAVLIFLKLKNRKPLLSLIGLIFGFVLMTAYSLLFIKPVLDFSGKTVDAEIFVRDISEKSGQSGTITAVVTLGGRKTKLSLVSEQPIPKEYFADVTIELSENDLNSRAALLSRGILLSGEIIEVRSVRYAGEDFYSGFRSVRENFLKKLSENVFGDAGALARAMLFGDGSRLSPAYTEYLRVSGAAHYTAVSGAHFAVFAAAALMIIPRRFRRLRLIVSLLFAPVGVLFFGDSPSVIRASAMFFIFAAAMLFHRKANVLNSLCIAVSVIPVVSPLTIADAGFAMSVLGVLGVGVIGPRLSAELCDFIPEKARFALSPALTALICSCCAVICTAPVSAALFKSVSLGGAVTSLALAPLMAVGMMFVLALGVFSFDFFGFPIELVMRLAAEIVKLLGRLRFLTLPLNFRAAWIICAAASVLLFVAAFDNRVFSKCLKAAGGLAALLVMISIVNMACRREVRFVGNTYTSAAVVFQKNTAAVFISGGGDNLGAGISRLLRENGAYKITKISAPDLDYGGALAVKELTNMLPVEVIYSNSLAGGLITELDVKPSDGTLEAGGFIIASADSGIDADILLYGNMNSAAESPARFAVYFSKKALDLPGNFHNARIDGDYRIISEE